MKIRKLSKCQSLWSASVQSLDSSEQFKQFAALTTLNRESHRNCKSGRLSAKKFQRCIAACSTMVWHKFRNRLSVSLSLSLSAKSQINRTKLFLSFKTSQLEILKSLCTTMSVVL